MQASCVRRRSKAAAAAVACLALLAAACVLPGASAKKEEDPRRCGNTGGRCAASLLAAEQQSLQAGSRPGRLANVRCCRRPLLLLLLQCPLVGWWGSGARMLEGAICCQSWGNSCVDNELTCCNGTCIAAAYNATSPQAACGIKAPPLCSFDALLEKTTKFDAANAWVMAVLATAVYPYPYAQQEKDDAGVR